MNGALNIVILMVAGAFAVVFVLAAVEWLGSGPFDHAAWLRIGERLDKLDKAVEGAEDLVGVDYLGSVLTNERRKTAEEITKHLGSIATRADDVDSGMSMLRRELIGRIDAKLAGASERVERFEDLAEALAVLYAHEKGKAPHPGEEVAFAVLTHWLERRAERQGEGPEGLLRRVKAELYKQAEQEKKP